MNKTKSVRYTSRAIFFTCDFSVVGIVLVLDQFLKFLAIEKLQGQSSHVLVDGLLQFTYFENPGAIFGVLPNQIGMVLFASIIFDLGLLYIIFKLPSSKKYRVIHLLLSLLMAGSIGNCLDRIRFGFVVEYIYFIGLNFPVFNLSDFMIAISTLILVFFFLFRYKEKDFDFLTFKQKRYRELK